MKKYIGLLFAAVALSGCTGAVVESVPADGGWPDGQARYGDRQLPSYGLPIAYYSLDVKRSTDSDGNCTLSVTLGDKPVFVRDPKTNFGLNYRHEWYTADHLIVETDGQGLLMTINGQSEDKTLAIVDQAFTTAADILKATAGGPAALMAAAGGAPVCRPFDETFLLDPQNSDEVKSANLRLRPAQVSIDALTEVDGSPIPGKATTTADATSACQLASPNSSQHGPAAGSEAACIYFRMARTFRMTVHDQQDDAAGHPQDNLHNFLLQAPDTRSIYAITMNRRPLVKFDTKLTFDHGVLTGFESDDPSEGLAIIQVPSDLIKDVTGLFPAPAAPASK